jgi:hypothetical protein
VATPSGGKPIDQGILAWAKGKYADWFGPNLPQPISAPEGTPPRQFDYPVGYNINIQPRNLEAVPFSQMRNLADSYDLVRLCIETRKDQLAKMKWDFAVKREPEETAKDFKQRNLKDGRLKELREFFQSPDKEHTWHEWCRLVMEEVLVIDALSITPLSALDGTLWESGKPLSLDVIDGSTIARKIDATGRTPQVPAVAYQQIIKGIPSCDFTKDQLIYKARNIRAHKFFGFSPVEQIILTINIGLRKQISTLDYYTEGNVPEAICMVPKEWSADQITEFQDWFDSKLAGNQAMRRRMTFVPEAGQITFTRDPKLKDEFDEWLIRVICYAFSLSPQPFIKEMNRATAETSVEQAKAEGLAPILLFFEDLINSIVLKYWGYDDVEFSWQAAEDQNPAEMAKIDDQYLRNGTVNIDEVRESLGKEPLADGSGKRNNVYTAMGITPIDTAIENADNPPEPDPNKQLVNGGEKKPPPPKPKKIWRQRPVQ